MTKFVASFSFTFLFTRETVISCGLRWKRAIHRVRSRHKNYKNWGWCIKNIRFLHFGLKVIKCQGISLSSVNYSLQSHSILETYFRSELNVAKSPPELDLRECDSLLHLNLLVLVHNLVWELEICQCSYMYWQNLDRVC